MRAKKFYPQTSNVNKNRKNIRSIRTLLMAFILMTGIPAVSFAGPTLSFINGTNQSFSICANTTQDLSSILGVNYSGPSTTLTWSVTVAPTSASIVALTYSRLSTVTTTTLQANAMIYEPNLNFSGNDAFTVTVTNGTVTATTTVAVFVNPITAIAGGNTSVCRTQSITLSDGASGGTWSSSNTTRATIDINSGVLTGAGNATGASTNVTITYKMPTGCSVTTTVTVNPLSLITGIPVQNVCAYGPAITLNDATTGGTWSAIGAPLTAGAGPGNETLTPQAAGPVSISYIMPTGCTATASLTVNPLPDPIIGAMPVCTGSIITLSDMTTNGTWSSSNTGQAIVGSGTGVVTGVNAGTPTIAYTLPTGCSATTIITVNPTPQIETSNACIGQTLLAGANIGGGTWSSSSTTVMVTSSGSVTGLVAGTASITYTLPTGCSNTATLTVNPLPAPITGTTTFCEGSTTTLSDATSSGLWSSASPAIATVGNSSGIVSSGTGTGYGTTTISYTLPTGCYASASVTVNQLGTISGNASLCIFSTTTLTDAPSGGTWSSSNANATIVASGSLNGQVTGVSWGTTTITYTTLQGCTATRTETVDSLPTLSSGTVCVGSEVILTHSPRFGTWSSSNTHATISLHSYEGHVHGVSVGLDTITYTVNATGCSNTATVAVNPLSPVSGPNTVCSGSTITLSDMATGGTWSSNNTSVASVNAATGVVTGQAVLTTSTATITYTTPAGCTATQLITVNPNPGPITGTTRVCEGQATTLYDLSTPGGAWTSSNTNVANVEDIDATSASVSGVSGGFANITYTTTATGCYTSASVTVNSRGVISGILFACRGTTTTLSETLAGQWAIDPLTPLPVTANIDPTTGIVTGNSNDGPTVIDFITTVGACVATTTVTIGSLPAITGPSVVCAGSTITLSDAVSGGTWSSSNTNATVGSGSGVVTGVASGTSNIVYTLIAGCSSAPKTITINPVPTITGASRSVCAGEILAPITFTYSPATGGTWSTSNTSLFVLPIFGFAIVEGTAAGTDTLTYKINATGCAAMVTVTVNPVPAPITGDLFVCPGISTTLSDATAGGTWSAANGDATIGSASGVVTGVSTGTDLISYTLNTGCTATAAFNVSNTLASGITGPTRVCMGQMIDLSDAATGGSWSSHDPTVGVVNATTGVVTGLSAGTTIITYSLGGSCSTIYDVAVDELSPILGNAPVCMGATITLSDTTFGGHWASANTSVATVNASTGVVTGVTNSSTTSMQAVISYILPTGCTTTVSVTVNPLPTAIEGIGTGVCFQSMTTLSDGVAGGTWSSSNTSIAVIDPNLGIVTTADTGTVVITYSLPTGCTAATASLTVNPLPVLTSTLTPPAICNNSLFSYVPTSDLATTQFQWQRNPVFGIRNGLTTGSTIISETLNDTVPNPVAVSYDFLLITNATGCQSTATVVVVVNPSAKLTSSLTDTICDSMQFTYVSTSATPSVTYTWHRAAVSGIRNPAKNGTGATITDTLANTTPNPVIVTYTDTLWYAGCSNVQTLTVTVNPRPMLSSPLSNGAICDSTLFVYGPHSLTHDSSFSWHRGFIPGIANPPASGVDTIRETLVNTTPDPIVVTYIDTIKAFGCSNTESVTVTVNPRPRLSSPLNPPPICDSTIFNYPPVSLTSGATFSWVRPYIPGIDLLAGSGTGNPNEVLVNTTNIDVTVTYIYAITANGCTDTQLVRVVVHPKPLLSSDPGPFSVCSGSPFSYAPTGYVLGTTFIWTRAAVAGIGPHTGSGTGDINETLTDSTLTPKNVTYVIIMNDTYPGGQVCSNSTNIELTVDPQAGVPPLTTYPPNSLCLNTMFQNFGVATPAPEGVEYKWTATNATVWAEGTPNQYALISFDSSAGPSVITVKSNVTGISCITSDTYVVTVGSTMSNDPQVIYSDGQFMCLQNLTVEASYQWGFDDAFTLDSTLIPGETNQTYFLSGPDLTYRRYWVITTQPDGCMQKSYYNTPAGVNNVNADVTDVKIYPNPANSIVNVEINTSVEGKYEIEVLDVLGQKISTIPVINHKAQISVTNLASGVYLIDSYRDGIKINSSRFVKN